MYRKGEKRESQWCVVLVQQFLNENRRSLGSLVDR